MTNSEFTFIKFERQFNYDWGYSYDRILPVGTVYLKVWKKGLYEISRSDWDNNRLFLTGTDLNELFEKVFEHFKLN